MELKGKMKGCVRENEMFLQWGELREGEHSYRAHTADLVLGFLTNLVNFFHQPLYWVSIAVLHSLIHPASISYLAALSAETYKLIWVIRGPKSNLELGIREGHVKPKSVVDEKDSIYDHNQPKIQLDYYKLIQNN